MDAAQRSREDEQTRRLLGEPGRENPPVTTDVRTAPVSSAAIGHTVSYPHLGGPSVEEDAATRRLLGDPSLQAQHSHLLEMQHEYPRPVAKASSNVPEPLLGGDRSNARAALAPSAQALEQDEATRRLLGVPGSAGASTQAKDRAMQRVTHSDPERHATLQEAKRAAESAEAEATCFRAVINGEIESAQLSAGNRGPLMCVFSVTHGADWTLVSGNPTGITQLAYSAAPSMTSMSATIQSDGLREVVWNFPIGLAFKATSPFGWPRVALTVYGTDLCNRRIIKGYGSVHVPCQPGRHTRVVRLYCPLSSSPLTRLLGALFGNPAQLVDPRMVTGTEGREMVRVQSGGRVRVLFDVLLKDTEAFGYTF